jgi:hypothetical protein
MTVVAGLLVSASIAAPASTASSEVISPTESPNQAYTVTKLWDTGRGFFTDYGQMIDTNRYYAEGYRFTDLPTGTKKTGTKISWCTPYLGHFCIGEIVHFQVRDTYALNSVCDKELACCYEGKEPVLFIHGYTQGTESITGGGPGTWADFPRLIQESGYVPFEYRWNTGTRFEDAAIELEKMIDLIHEKTGERVHIVAHSFGGLLVRTMLQGIHLESGQDEVLHRGKMSLDVASIVTLGTPHSGIFNNDTFRNGIAFPTGRDFPILPLCGQITCHQAGQDMLKGRAATFFGVEDEAGELMPKLADIMEPGYRFPNVNILALIGLTTRRGGSDLEVDRGDALITYEGQRFYPWDTMDGLTKMDPPRALRHGVQSDILGALVSERILGFPDDTVPGAVNPVDPSSDNKFDRGGYRHSMGVEGRGFDRCVGASLGDWYRCKDTSPLPPRPPAEPYVVCAAADEECEHKSFQEVLAWISDHAAHPIKFAVDELVEVTADDVPVLDAPNGEVMLQTRSAGDRGHHLADPDQ